MERIAEVAVIKLRKCANVFGVSPCTATGAPFCYNCKKTCRDVMNFDGSDTLEIPMTHVDGPLMKDRHAHRCITSLVVLPGTLNMKEGVGAYGSISISCVDFEGDDASDSNADPYYTQRSAVYPSTFARKFMARYPYAKGQTIERRRYSVDDDGISTLLTTDTFRFEGLTPSRGTFTIEGSDFTPRMDSELIPRPSTYSLASAVDASTTTFVLQSGEGALVSAGEYVQFDDEIVLVSVVSTDTLTVQRAKLGTVAAAHEEDTRGQFVYVDEGTVDELWANALDYVGYSSAIVDAAGAATEVGILYESSFTPRIVQAQPVKLRKLMVSFMSQVSAFTFFEPRAGKFKLRLVRPALSSETVETITAEANMSGLPDGPVPQEDLRITQLYMYFDVQDWSKDVQKLDLDRPNFRRVQFYEDVQKEGTDEFGEVKTLEVFASTLRDGDDTEALGIGFRKMSLFKFAPRSFRTSVPGVDVEDKAIRVGNFLEVTAPEFVTSEGQEKPTTFIVVGISPEAGGDGLVRLELYELGYEGKWWTWADDAETDTEKFAQWSDDDGLLPDDSEGWRWV